MNAQIKTKSMNILFGGRLTERGREKVVKFTSTTLWNVHFRTVCTGENTTPLAIHLCDGG